MANFLTLPIFQEIILPFLLIFVLIFAILQKSKLLGDDKTQIDALIGFLIAAILIGFSQAVTYIAKFTVFLSVGLVILFVFLLLYGFAWGTDNGDPLKQSETLKKWIGGIVFVAVIIGALIITETWDKVWNFFTSGGMGQNVLFIILIIAAVVAVVFSGKKGESKSSS